MSWLYAHRRGGARVAFALAVALLLAALYVIPVDPANGLLFTDGGRTRLLWACLDGIAFVAVLAAGIAAFLGVCAFFWWLWEEGWGSGAS